MAAGLRESSTQRVSFLNKTTHGSDCMMFRVATYRLRMYLLSKFKLVSSK